MKTSLIKDLELFQLQTIPDSIHYVIINQVVSGLSNSKENVNVLFYDIRKGYCLIELVFDIEEYVDINISSKYIEYRGFGLEYMEFYDSKDILEKNIKLISVFLKENS